MQSRDFDEGARWLRTSIWLHQFARRAAVYGVIKVKRVVSANVCDNLLVKLR